ncbi:MetQ/NlpA family ABC transporter substrate-binding protein [Paenibacillus sp. GCM10023252]|uniref:MetQ/NlpA family ABC transporter substrate-binding protein n=1 Tax=Paenibacillus sp. GCM10023252 TaxID=3252649 RepID=UPI00361F9598
MSNQLRRAGLVSLVLLLTMVVLAACGGGSKDSGSSADKKDIKVGFIPGPYADQFKSAIQPILEKKGYTVKITELSNAIQPNTSVKEGSLDVNIFQNDGFMKSFNEENKAELMNLMTVPTAPLGIYSKKAKSLDDIKDGAIVSVPLDPTNLARALVLLEKAGLVKIKTDIDPLTATEKDLAENPKNIKFRLLEAPQLPRSLEDVDYSVITGNHVIAAGMKLSEAIQLEEPEEKFQIIVTIRPEDKDKPFVKAIEEAYKSEEFRKFVETDENAIGFSKPSYWK